MTESQQISYLPCDRARQSIAGRTNTERFTEQSTYGLHTFGQEVRISLNTSRTAQARRDQFSFDGRRPNFMNIGFFMPHNLQGRI